jgi:hypothetical protein
MATYKILGQSYPSSGVNTDVYTVPDGYSCVISTINICNLSATDRLFRIAVRPGNALLGDRHYIAYDTALPANDSIALSIGITLSETDVIVVYSNGSVSFSVFGSEILN